VTPIRFAIGLCVSRDGMLLIKPASYPPHFFSVSHDNAHFDRCGLYDDDRGRRLIYEVNPNRDEFRYVLECDQPGGDVQGLVFPTLRGAVFCLAGCISRDE
jgi:hypothetical protein